MITCKDCLRALHPYLDRELDDADLVFVQAHLHSCPPCLHLFDFEASIRRLVQVRCLEQRAPDGLAEKVLGRLAFEAMRGTSSARRRGPGHP